MARWKVAKMFPHSLAFGQQFDLVNLETLCLYVDMLFAYMLCSNVQ